MLGIDPGQTASMINRNWSHSKTYYIMKLSNEIISRGIINMNNSRLLKSSTWIIHLAYHNIKNDLNPAQ